MILMDKKKYTFYLPIELVEELKKLSSQTRIPMTKFIIEAIEDLLKKYEKR
jgi:predicted DNA-binding protein